jgi:hypothetical protein
MGRSLARGMVEIKSAHNEYKAEDVKLEEAAEYIRASLKQQ